MRTADFDFELPPELIADEPARPRDAARLLDVRRRPGGPPCPRPARPAEPRRPAGLQRHPRHPRPPDRQAGRGQGRSHPPQARGRRYLACLRQARQAAAGRRHHRLRARPVGAGDGEARGRRHSAPLLGRGRRADGGPAPLRRHAAAALYPPARRRFAQGRRGLPDRLRRPRGRGGGSHRRASLHAGPAGARWKPAASGACR